MITSHSLLFQFRTPSMTIVPCLYTHKFHLSNTAMKSSSHNCPMDNNKALLSSSNTWLFFADVCSNLCNGKIPDSVVFMLSPFGMPTFGPLFNFVIFCNTFLLVFQIYVFVAPESALQTIQCSCLGGIMVSLFVELFVCLL